MASFLAQASRACASRSARTVCSVSGGRRSFTFAAARVAPRLLVLSGVRYGSALATSEQHRPSTVTPTPSPPNNDSLPTFLSLKGVIDDRLLSALIEKPMSLTHMSAVQAEVFPLLPELARPYSPDEPNDAPPRDLLVKAKTGTGKTLGFLLPAMEARLKAIEAYGKQALRDGGLQADKGLESRAQLAFARQNVGALIITPTRELATQIASEALRLTRNLGSIGVRTLIGGESKGFQMRGWMQGRRDIIVATPGRLRDLLMTEPEVKRGLEKTQVLILDEADTLLDMGFIPDIDAIKKCLPPVPERQTFLFSATVSRSIQAIARSTLSPKHKFINCVSADSSPVHAHVEQFHTVLPSSSHQIPHLMRLIAHDQLSNPGASKVIVFLPTTKMTQLFATALRELSRTTLPAGRHTHIYEIHSKRLMQARTNTSAAFRADKSGASVLVSSDVSARGIDYPGVTRVIQVGIPSGPEQYIHRVGRTGRANSQGRGDLILMPWELGFVSHGLKAVPLKPLTIHELSSQLHKLAKDFDENPREFFSGAPVLDAPAARHRDSRGRGREVAHQVIGHDKFHSPLSAAVQDVERNITDFVGRLDEEAIRETFMSLLGFYVGKTAEMRIQKHEMVEGLKAWSTEACGLPVAPYVSAAFLQKLGMGDQRSTSRGFAGRQGGRNGDYGNPPRRNSWEERGSQRMKSNSNQTREPQWNAFDSDRRSRPSFRSEGSSFGGRGDGGYKGGRSGGSGGYGDRSGGFGGSERSSRGSSQKSW